MYKIVENGQIIDVLESLTFIKHLSRSGKNIMVDERQANGVLGSDGETIYHIHGTKYNFYDSKKTVQYIKIDQEEYERLTQQLKSNQDLEKRVRELEEILRELYRKIV